MPDFLDPINLIGYFGTWALVGILVVVFVESGVLFPILPGDTLLFVAGMLAAGTAARADAVDANFHLWQLLVFIPVAAILGGRSGTGSGAAWAPRCSSRTRACSSSATSTKRTCSSSNAGRSRS